MPALPLDEAGKYVAAAYIVFFTLLVVYLSIMAAKVARIERELTDLADLADKREQPEREEEPVV
jgi:CcmD family protein